MKRSFHDAHLVKVVYYKRHQSRINDGLHLQLVPRRDVRKEPDGFLKHINRIPDGGLYKLVIMIINLILMLSFEKLMIN